MPTTQIYDEFSMFDNVAVEFLDDFYGSGDDEFTGKDSNNNRKESVAAS